MNIYQIIGGGIFIACFCIGFIARAIQVSRRDPWWCKILTFFLTLIVVGLLGGMGIYSTLVAYEQIGRPLPHMTLPTPPIRWWR